MSFSLLLIVLAVAVLMAFAFVICGFVIAFRSRNPVVKWGFGIAAGVTLLLLIAGTIFVFSGAVLSSSP